jgi:hypothetical protein
VWVRIAELIVSRRLKPPSTKSQLKPVSTERLKPVSTERLKPAPLVAAAFDES